MKKTTIVILSLLVAAVLPLAAAAQITSSASGSWTDGTTWTGGIVPSATDDVFIQSGHTISIDGVDAVCRNVSFGGDDALIDVNANGMITVYGDFTLFSTSHTVFSAGWSATNAYIRFAGSAVQTLSGFNPSGGSTSFRDVIVDKDGGKLTTSGGGMRLGIQNSLEIVNGLFELAVGDDIEGRWASSGNYRGNDLPNVVIRAGGEFTMISGSGAHHIRSNSTDGGLPIGTFTVYGKATFIDASSYRISLNGVDIEDGGKVITSTGMGGGEFNCGPMHIKSGGELENYTTSDCWSATSTVTLDDGGLFDTKSSTTIFPLNFVNNGLVRYSREGTTDQQIVDMDYQSLEISLDDDNNKNWDLAADRTIANSLKVNYSANLVLTAAAPRALVINSLLNLTSGQLDNSDPDVALTMADGSMIQRATGSLTGAPMFAGMVDLRYTSTAMQISTGFEIPAVDGVINDFTVSGDQGVNLDADILVGGTCTTSGSDLITGPHTVTLGPAAALVESDGMTVLGTVTASRDVAQAVNETFGGMGLEVLAAATAPGLMEVTRTTGSFVDKDYSDGIERYFDISAVNNAGLDATVVFHYDESELNGIPETSLVLYSDDGAGWAQLPSLRDEPANTVTSFDLDTCTRFTLGSEGVVSNTLQSLTVVPNGSGIDISWRTSDFFAAEDFAVSRFEGNSGTGLVLDSPVVSTGDATFLFIDNTVEPGTSYRYRVEVKSGDQTRVLFETDPIEIQLPRIDLGQNFPNPFNPMTEINYSIPRTGHVYLDIFDAAGRRVVRLVDSVQTAGSHREVWLGLDQAGQAVSSGTYFYQMVSDEGTLVKKMVLLR